MPLPERWKQHTLSEGTWVRKDFGSLSIVVLKAHDEWRVACWRDADASQPAEGNLEELPQGLEWERWDHHAKDQIVMFRPTYPILPVVARPFSVLNLSPKGMANFFIGIPAWIEVVAQCEGRLMPLTAFPTTELSKTWHGTPQAGHLGCALRTYARRVYEVGDWADYDIVCPISLVNDGDVMLPFNRLYLETDHLSVFELDGRLWSNAARIRSSPEQSFLSDITYAARPPKPFDEALEITTPRKGRARKSTMRSAFNKVLESLNPLEE